MILKIFESNTLNKVLHNFFYFLNLVFIGKNEKLDMILIFKSSK
jgi:hypothetical protein